MIPALALSLLAAEPRWGLTFKPSDGCIGAAELAERIEKRLGHPIFGANPDVRIEGWLKPTEPPHRWRARLTLVNADGTVQGSREVTSDGASCRSIDDSLTLVAAVMIDPAAALGKGAPPPEPTTEFEPPPPEVHEPPPPPSSEPPPPPSLAMPKMPPRDQWPGYVLVESGDSITQNGRWLGRNSFYRIVGRPDLDASYTRRQLTKSLSFLAGSVGLTTGLVLMLLQPANISCTRYEGTPQSKGACLEASPWPIISGAITLGVGLAFILFGALLKAVPTTGQEDVDLADTYNSKLKPPLLPITAAR